jgi:Ca2+-binding EF-hand superfamily protein
LDTQNKGHFTIEELRRYFVQYGEPFSSDEMEEMLNAAVTSEARLIQYKTFLHYLSIDEEQRL